jgi:hypothetical protein
VSDGDDRPPTFDAVARLYLGNILYALETAAVALQDEAKAEDAAFYRGIARELAAAYGRDAVAR